MIEPCTRRLDPNARILGRLGPLETRLARSRAEIRAAQSLRYRVFYEEMGARPSAANRLLKRDKDPYDRYCDHLLVIDKSGTVPEIIGTYRLLMQAQASQAGGFYTQSEYDLTPLLKANDKARFLELGRSCVLPDYRNKRTMELLWHGNWAHCVSNKVDIMFGCASFEGTDPQAFAAALGWLGSNAGLESKENCPAVVENSVALSDLASSEVSLRQAMAIMPPLIKGYLRLGARIGSHAVIDHQFGTIDVLVVLKVAQINPRYLAHYGVDASRYAA